MAYDIIRNNGHLFLSLFSLMVSTGMPSLQKEEDLTYFKEAMKFGIGPFSLLFLRIFLFFLLTQNSGQDEAEKEFEALIQKSLKNTRVYLNNVVHIWANS